MSEDLVKEINEAGVKFINDELVKIKEFLDQDDVDDKIMVFLRNHVYRMDIITRRLGSKFSSEKTEGIRAGLEVGANKNLLKKLLDSQAEDLEKIKSNFSGE